MQAIRHLIAQRRLAVLICAMTLLLKLVVPTGYMIASDDGRIAVTMCSGTVPAPTAADVPGMHHAMAGHGDPQDHGKSRDHRKSEHGKAEMPCAFSGLSAAVLGPIDAIQLAALIAFGIALGLAAVVPSAPLPATYLRPPLRAPPAYR